MDRSTEIFRQLFDWKPHAFSVSLRLNSQDQSSPEVYDIFTINENWLQTYERIEKLHEPIVDEFRRECRMNDKRSSDLPIIGWREWVKLPDFDVPRIKAKVDTGARSSSLHASDIEEYEIDGVIYVRFRIHPFHRKPEAFVEAKARVIDFRKVKSSSGQSTNRPVISTTVVLLDQSWPVELTLAGREGMGFRMLLGREAFRGKFLVDSGKSYYGGKPKRKRKRKKEPE